MEQSESTVNNCLVFAVNGKRFEVSTIHPSTTVLEFLRSHTPFKGPKLSCGEGIYLSSPLYSRFFVLYSVYIYMFALVICFSLSLCLLVSQFGFSFSLMGIRVFLLCVLTFLYHVLLLILLSMFLYIFVHTYL